MTVQELIDELSKVEDKTLGVVLQIDPEGNGYHPVRGGEPAWYDDGECPCDEDIGTGEVELSSDARKVFLVCP